MLIREIPFLRFMIPLCAGIIAGLYLSPDKLFFLSSSAVIITFFCISLRFNGYLTNTFYGATISAALFIMGLLLYTDEKKSISCLEPGESVYSGTLSDYPEEKNNSIRLMLKLDSEIVNERKKKVSGSILIYFKKNNMAGKFLPGDDLVVRCTPVNIKSRGNPFEFDYRSYMQNMGIKYYAFADSSDICLHSGPVRRSLAHRALIIRERIIEMFRERGISGERLAVVSAITLGQKNMLEPEQKLSFMKAGIMHIMAVSGLHAVILSMFVFRLLFFLKGRFGIIRVLFTLIILWAFAFVTGLTPSVLRATLMYSFLQAGNIMKRPINGINSVLASAYVLILSRPSVIFDAGFLLSYTAVIYIITFYRDLYLKIRLSHRIADWLWQSIAVTLIAQAGTLPLTITLFNRFPTWFLLSNVIIVPVSSLVIITGCVLPLTYPVVFLSRTVAAILNFLTWLTETLTEKAANLPYSTIENIGMTTTECILLTVFIFLLMRFLLVKKSVPALFPLSAFLLFVTAGTVKAIMVRTTDGINVYNTEKHAAIGIRTGRRLTLFSDTGIAGNEVKRHCAVLGLRLGTKVITADPVLLNVKGKKIMISSSADLVLLRKTSADILIMTGKYPLIRTDITQRQKLKAVIISPEASVRSGFLEKNLRGCADTVHYVRQNGAFNMKL